MKNINVPATLFLFDLAAGLAVANHYAFLTAPAFVLVGSR